MFFSTFLSSYINEGIGYNAHPAGGSNKKDLSDEEWKKFKMVAMKMQPKLRERAQASRRRRAKKADEKKKEEEMEIEDAVKKLEKMKKKVEGMRQLIHAQEKFLELATKKAQIQNS